MSLHVPETILTWITSFKSGLVRGRGGSGTPKESHRTEIAQPGVSSPPRTAGLHVQSWEARSRSREIPKPPVFYSWFHCVHFGGNKTTHIRYIFSPGVLFLTDWSLFYWFVAFWITFQSQEVTLFVFQQISLFLFVMHKAPLAACFKKLNFIMRSVARLPFFT